MKCCKYHTVAHSIRHLYLSWSSASKICVYSWVHVFTFIYSYIYREGELSIDIYVYMHFYIDYSSQMKDHQLKYYFSWKYQYHGKNQDKEKQNLIHPTLSVYTEIIHPGEQIEEKKKGCSLLHFPHCQRILHAADTSVAIMVPSVKTETSLRLDRSPLPNLRGVKANSVLLSKGYLWM